MYLSNLYKNIEIISEKKEELHIQIGNSADSSNNHFEILNKLEKFKNKNIKLFCILSYGDKIYAEKVIKYGEKIFKEKFIPIEKIIKITSGMDGESAETIAQVYELIIEVGVHRASSIKVAEAAKVIENSQRDVNIAFVNELAMIFEKMNIDTQEVLEAAGTKWNFLSFRPGLVGGHCIGVDPYYLTYKSEEMGYKSQLISAGRLINNGMSKFVAEKCVKMLINLNIKVKGAKILILGLTFKEDCPDLRNSKIVDIIKELKEYEVEILVVDSMVDKKEAFKEYGIKVLDIEEIKEIDGIIGAVKHKYFLNYKEEKIKRLFKKNLYKPLILDLKGIFEKEKYKENYKYWRM